MASHSSSHLSCHSHLYACLVSVMGFVTRPLKTHVPKTMFQWPLIPSPTSLASHQYACLLLIHMVLGSSFKF